MSNKAAGIFFTDGKKVLLLKKAKKGENGETWGLPGGKGEKGETAISTAIRETKEETGLKKIPGKRFDSIVTKTGKSKTFTTYMYLVDDYFDVVKLSSEHVDWKWASFREMKNMKLHPKFEDAMPQYLNSVSKKIMTFSEWVDIQKMKKELGV